MHVLGMGMGGRGVCVCGAEPLLYVHILKTSLVSFIILGSHHVHVHYTPQKSTPYTWTHIHTQCLQVDLEAGGGIKVGKGEIT